MELEVCAHAAHNHAKLSVHREMPASRTRLFEQGLDSSKHNLSKSPAPLLQLEQLKAVRTHHIGVIDLGHSWLAFRRGRGVSRQLDLYPPSEWRYPGLAAAASPRSQSDEPSCAVSATENPDLDPASGPKQDRF